MAIALGLMPVLGTTSGALVFGAGFIAWLYVLMLWPVTLEPRERLIGAIFFAYVIVGLIFGIGNVGLIPALEVQWNNVGFILTAPLLPILRIYHREYWDRWMQYAVALGGLGVGASALWEVSQGALQVEALTGNPLVFAYLCGAATLLNGSLALHSQGRFRALHTCATVSGVIAMVLSGSRGPTIYFALVAILGIAIWLFRYSHHRLRDSMLAIGATSAAAAATYVLFRDTAAFQTTVDRFARLFQSEGATGVDASVDARIAMLKAGWAAFLDHPFLGYGRPAVIDAANAQFPDDMVFSFSHLHNAYLNEAVSSGVFGLMVYLAVLVTPLIVARRAPAPWRDGCWLFTAFTAACVATNIGFYHDLTVAYFCGLVVIVNCIGRNGASAEPTYQVSR